MRRVIASAAGLGLLIATAARAEIHDLGRYGPTCPVPAPPPGRPLTVRLEPGLARVRAPMDPPMPIAAARRTYGLPGRWPAGAPPVVVFVGRDGGSLAVVRTLPPGTPVYVLPSEGRTEMDAFRQACPGCRVGMAGTAGARRLGIRAVPAVIRVVDGAAHVTEGPP